jgi:hypothetical protein
LSYDGGGMFRAISLSGLLGLSIVLRCFGASAPVFAAERAGRVEATRVGQAGAVKPVEPVQPVEPVEKVQQAIAELVNRHLNGAKDPKEFSIAEQDANLFLRGDPTRPLPDGVESPWVRFEDEVAVVGATVDLDKFRGSLPGSALLSLLTGRVPVEITARVGGEKGIGKLELIKFLVAGIELPKSLVASLAETETASKLLPPGFKVGESFPLPYEIESIRCRVGALSLTQGPTPVPSAK